MLATSTHDNKRSEDVRARIDVISELPAAWRLLVRRWSRLNRRSKRVVDGQTAPSRNDEYLLYQTLVGTFPHAMPDPAALAGYRTRIETYMLKAVREAKVRSSWLNVNEKYEAALCAFVRDLLGGGSSLFLDDLAQQARLFAWFGALNSASMALIKTTSPGVPDIFQGNEILDYSLVDPDNRRRVDYEVRRRMLKSLRDLGERPSSSLGPAVRELLVAACDGRAKLWLFLRALDLRRRQPELFSHGDYVPVKVTGSKANHVLAYARRRGRRGMLVAAGRMFASLGLEPGSAPVGAEVWHDTSLDASILPADVSMIDELTGATVQAAGSMLDLRRVFQYFPGAILSYET